MQAVDPKHQDFVDAVEIANDAGEISTDYSGRGMFGRECLAITFNNYQEEASFFFRLGQNFDGPMPRVKSDSMGRGTIVYWESVSITQP